MSGAFIGEVRRFGGSYAPDGWLFCDGRFLGVEDYADLFAVIGHRFGGSEGRFAIPNLNEAALATSGVGYIIATTGRMPVQPKLQVEL
jgi:microcystin-dependent protein